MADGSDKHKRPQESDVISQMLKPKSITRSARGFMLFLSIFISISLWYYVSSDGSLRVSRVQQHTVGESGDDGAPTVARPIVPELEISDGLPDGVEIERVAFEPESVRIMGTQEAVTSVKRAVARASFAEIDGASPTCYVILLDENGAPIEGLAPSPPAVRITAEMTERVREVSVPIRASITGAPAAGYEAGATVIEPTEAVFRGPASAIANISEITLPPIDITGQKSALMLEIPIPTPAQGVTVLGSQNVSVRVDIRAPVETMTFVGVPVAVSGQGGYDRWTISPQYVNVTVERSMTSSEQFDTSAPPVEIFVDVTNIVAKRVVLPVLERGLAHGMRVVRVEPRQVTVSAVQ